MAMRQFPLQICSWHTLHYIPAFEGNHSVRSNKCSYMGNLIRGRLACSWCFMLFWYKLSRESITTLTSFVLVQCSASSAVMKLSWSTIKCYLRLPFSCNCLAFTCFTPDWKRLLSGDSAIPGMGVWVQPRHMLTDPCLVARNLMPRLFHGESILKILGMLEWLLKSKPYR